MIKGIKAEYVQPHAETLLDGSFHDWLPAGFSADETSDFRRIRRILTTDLLRPDSTVSSIRFYGGSLRFSVISEPVLAAVQFLL